MSFDWAGKAYLLFKTWRIETGMDYFKAALFILFLSLILEAIVFERFYTNSLRKMLRPEYRNKPTTILSFLYSIVL